MTSGNESQESCPKLQTAEKIAAVSGVSPRTIKNDAHFAEAVDVLVADSAPMARLLEQTNRTAATLMKIGWPISAAGSTGLRSRRMVRRSGTTIGQFKGATNPRKLAPLKKPPKKLHWWRAQRRGNWLAYQRGRQYRAEKKQQGGTGANQYTVEQSGQVSGKTDHSAKNADRIALASGVKPITVRRDADYSEAIDVLVADSAPIATRSLEQPRHEKSPRILY